MGDWDLVLRDAAFCIQESYFTPPYYDTLPSLIVGGGSISKGWQTISKWGGVGIFFLQKIDPEMHNNEWIVKLIGLVEIVEYKFNKMELVVKNLPNI